MRRRRRFVAVSATSALALGLAAFLSAKTLIDSGPSTASAPRAGPLLLEPSAVVEQTFFSPACDLRVLRLGVAEPISVSSRLRVTLLSSDEVAGPVGIFGSEVPIGPGPARWLDIGLEGLAQARHRRLTLRLELVGDHRIALETRTPRFRWPGVLHVNGIALHDRALAFSALPTPATRPAALSCALGNGRSGAWLPVALAAGCLLLLTSMLAGISLSVAAASPSTWARAGAARRAEPGVVPARLLLVPALMTAAGGLTWLLVVPPFEAPDEPAHLQYARFVATTHHLPDAVPDADSPWRRDYYEWVQPPLHYVLSGTVLVMADLADAEPTLEGNPRSLVAGGRERTVYAHEHADVGGAGRKALYALRSLNLALSVVLVVIVFLLTREHLGHPSLAMIAASSLALVPQWSAILSMAGNDTTATLLAALASLLLLRVGTAAASPRLALAGGLAVGAALSTKLTTAFLLPMALCALASPHLAGVRRRSAITLAVGLVAGGGWFYGRNWLVFGDPLASDFKRALLEQSGFLALSQAQPGPFDAAFWRALESQVFHAFWARFGSLGVGPDPASRLWWLYGGLTAGLALTLAAAVASLRQRERHWAIVTAAVGVASGIAGWLAVNLAARPDVIVHWTPRHVLPLTAPAVLLAAVGARRLASALGVPPWLRSAGAALTLWLLGLAWIVTLRHVVQQFHMGYN